MCDPQAHGRVMIASEDPLVRVGRIIVTDD